MASMTMASIVASTRNRVPAHTAQDVNRLIAREIEESVGWHARHPEMIEDRLADLDHEWDIERTLEANAAGVSLIGLGLAIIADRRWMALPVGVAAFLLQHAIQGWCPPILLFRRLGVRTRAEIETERNAIKALRGDVVELEARLPETADRRARPALAAARA